VAHPEDDLTALRYEIDSCRREIARLRPIADRVERAEADWNRAWDLQQQAAAESDAATAALRAVLDDAIPSWIEARRLAEPWRTAAVLLGWKGDQ